MVAGASGPPLTEIGVTFSTVPAGETVIANEAEIEVLAIDVAVTVATEVVVTVAGAVYVTEVVVAALNAPTPESDQLTPSPVESLVTVATMSTTPLALTDAELGERETVTARPEGVPLLPQPTRNPRVPTKTITKKLRTLSSLL
jgi:hypothetical protein